MVSPHTEYPRRLRRPNGRSGRVSPLSQEEFWQFWREHEPFLLQLCLSWMNGDQTEAREALSGAMMKAVEGTTIEQLPDIGNIRAWLVRIVKNHCLDLQRQRSRRQIRMTEFDGLSGFAESIGLNGLEVSPETGFVRQEDYQRILRAIESLPERLREVIILRAYQNMPYKEIARNLCITADSARKRAEHGRALLDLRLREDSPHEARGPRSAHESGIGVRSERRAAEEILEKPAAASLAPNRFVHLPAIHLNETRSVEVPIFLERRPIRIAQRLEALQRYIKRHPGGWSRENELAEVLFTEGRMEEAASHYRSVLSRQPHLYQVAEALADCHYHLGRILEALGILKSYLPALPNQEVRMHFLALISRLQGKFADAISFWEEAGRLSGQNRSYVLNTVEVYLRLGKTEEAERLLDPLLNESPCDRKTMHLALQSAGGNGCEETYGKLMERISIEFRDDPVAVAHWLTWRIGQGELATSERKIYSRAVSKLKAQLGGSVLWVHLQASWLFHQGKKAACRKLILELMKENPGLREALLVASHWLNVLGDSEGATEMSDAHTHLFGQMKHLPPSFLDSVLWKPK